MTDLAINLTRTINSPINQTFDAWLDPKILSKFMTPMPGMPEPRTEVDACVGGRFAIFMIVGDQEVPHRGTYLEIDRPNKLAFTWESPFSVEGSTVTISFSETSDNRTEIQFSHVKFADEGTRADHEGGWTEILNKLEDVTSNLIAA